MPDVVQPSSVAGSDRVHGVLDTPHNLDPGLGDPEVSPAGSGEKGEADHVTTRPIT